jgi:hypothetical protein
MGLLSCNTLTIFLKKISHVFNYVLQIGILKRLIDMGIAPKYDKGIKFKLCVLLMMVTGRPYSSVFNFLAADGVGY